MDEHRHSIVNREGRETASEVVVPLAEEHVEVEKRVALRERVLVTRSTTTRDEVVDVPLLQEEVLVERVPVGRIVEAEAAPRQEGDTLIVPVYEEVLVVEKRLLLREEVRITRSRREAHEPQHVNLRREEVDIVRKRPNGEDG